MLGIHVLNNNLFGEGILAPKHGAHKLRNGENTAIGQGLCKVAHTGGEPCAELVPKGIGTDTLICEGYVGIDDGTLIGIVAEQWLWLGMNRCGARTAVNTSWQGCKA